nr:hypothetical protein [Tanacetum cinerariifolium]
MSGPLTQTPLVITQGEKRVTVNKTGGIFAGIRLSIEFNPAKIVQDSHDVITTADRVQPETVLADDGKHHSSTDTMQGYKVDTHGHENVEQSEDYADIGSGDVNMEASISADDVMRAGGFGARDDISSFLPVASDSTDFEASLRDARGYEEPQKDICRPGLGWKDVKDQD